MTNEPKGIIFGRLYDPDEIAALEAKCKRYEEALHRIAGITTWEEGSIFWNGWTHAIAAIVSDALNPQDAQAQP